MVDCPFLRCVRCDGYIALTDGDHTGQLLGHLLAHMLEDVVVDSGGGAATDCSAAIEDCGHLIAPLLRYLRTRFKCQLLPMFDRVDYFHTWLVVQDRMGLVVDWSSLNHLYPGDSVFFGSPSPGSCTPS